MVEKLSRTMLYHLRRLEKGLRRVPFQTGEALRRRGLVYRRSFVVTRDYVATKEGETEQVPATWLPREVHEWVLLKPGRVALAAQEEKK